MALLTAEQLEKLRQIIRDASTSLAISTTGMEVPEHELQRLVTEGYIDPDDLHNIVLDSYEYGRLMAQLPRAKEMSYQKFINYLAKNPVELTDQEKRAFEFLQGRAGQFCVSLGTRYEGEVTLAAADMDQELAEAFRYTLQSEAGRATARRETIGRLTTRLRQMSDDWARDWGRIASTESHIAHQMGFIEDLAERYGQGEGMAKIPEESACPDCRRLYLDANGRPRVEPVEWWQGQGVANYGLKRADWRPVMGAMHPWCLLPGQRVLTWEGFKPVKDIPLGALVHTHLGRWRPVTQQHRHVHIGQIVELELSDGTVLRVTPNHLFWNGEKWQPAKLCGEGGHVFKIPLPKGNHRPAGVFKPRLLGRILLGLTRDCMPVAAIDFNGDLARPVTEIDKESAHDLVWHEGEASGEKGRMELLLLGGEKASRKTLKTADNLVVRTDAAPIGFIGSQGEFLALLGGHALHSDLLSLRERALADPSLLEALDDGASRHPELAGYRLYGEILLEVQVDEFLDIESYLPHPADPKLIPVSVKSRRILPYKGSVFNLAVQEDESYVVEGVVSHNCQCQVVRVPAGWGFDESWDLVPEEMIEKSAAARSGEVREWRTGWHQKQADGSWKPVSSALAYASRTLHRGLGAKWDQVQDLIQGVKDGDPEATKTAAAIMALMPSMKGFRGLVVAVPSSKAGKSPLTGLAAELNRQGVGQAHGGMRRVQSVHSSRERRQKGKRGLTAAQHADSMGVDLSKVPPDVPILLVDDIFTSGATLEGAALALRRAGHKGPISAATAGRFEDVPTVEDSPFTPAVVHPGKEPTPVGKVVRRKKWSKRIASWKATLAALAETRPGLAALAAAEAYSRTGSEGGAIIAGATELMRSEDVAKARKLHYKTTFRGLPISIENRRGSKRYWYDPHTKTSGETLMRWPYGYIRMTEGADGDHVDVFLGPHEDAKFAYVIHQMKAPDFKKPDEDKVMLGFLTAKRAKKEYLRHFDSPKFYGSMSVIPIQKFVDHALGGDYRDGREIRKAGAEPARQRQFVWEPIPHGKRGGQRRRKPGGGYEYKYPEFEVPKMPKTHRGQRIYFTRQQEINRQMAADPIAAVSTVYFNVSGGGERARFVPVSGVSGLGGRNLGVQITAHEIPKSRKAIDRFAQHAHREGLKLMVDSGEFPRFAAEMSIPGQESKVRELMDADARKEEIEKAHAKLERLKAKSLPLDFDRIYDAYDRLAEAFPAGTVTVVAPDKIGDAAKTAELRAQYKERTQELMDRGVHFIVPFQARTAEGLAQDYVAAAEAFGEGNFTIGLPMAKKPMPMDVMIPFVTKLYRAGQFPKLHFLGGSQPEQMAERTIQLVAAAYWSARGLTEERVLELAKTPRDALRGLSKVKSAKDVLTQEAEAALEPRMRAWAGVAEDDPEFDPTEAWVDFFDAHPEEFDLELDQKEGAFRQWAADLVQFDTSTVNRAVMLRKEHALTAEQQRVSGYLAETPKRERHPGTLDRYLQAREFQMERFIPPEASGLESLLGRYDKSYLGRWRDLIKAAETFRGSAGYVGTRRPVGTMGNVGKPARTPGENTFAAQAPTDHPYGPDARKKKKKKKRKKKDLKEQKDAIAISKVSYVDGYVMEKPMVDVPPSRDAKHGREWLDEQAERRSRRRDQGKLTIRPQDVRS